MASLSFSPIKVTPSGRDLRSCRRQSTARSGQVGFRVFNSEGQAEPDISVSVNGLQMPNPFVIGSGPPGTNYTVMKRAFDEGWGAVIAKTVSFCLPERWFGCLGNVCSEETFTVDVVPLIFLNYSQNPNWENCFEE